MDVSPTTEGQLPTIVLISSGTAFSSCARLASVSAVGMLSCRVGAAAPSAGAAITPFSSLSSITRILSSSDPVSVSIPGLHSLIRAISIKIRFCAAYLICPASSEKIRIYRITASASIRSASSFKRSRFSEETSIISSIESEVFASRRLRRYHVKSVTN